MSNELGFVFVIVLQMIVMMLMSFRMDRIERRIRNLELEAGLEPEFE